MQSEAKASLKLIYYLRSVDNKMQIILFSCYPFDLFLLYLLYVDIFNFWFLEKQ